MKAERAGAQSKSEVPNAVTNHTGWLWRRIHKATRGLNEKLMAFCYKNYGKTEALGDAWADFFGHDKDYDQWRTFVKEYQASQQQTSEHAHYEGLVTMFFEWTLYRWTPTFSARRSDTSAYSHSSFACGGLCIPEKGPRIEDLRKTGATSSQR